MKLQDNIKLQSEIIFLSSCILLFL